MNVWAGLYGVNCLQCGRLGYVYVFEHICEHVHVRVWGMSTFVVSECVSMWVGKYMNVSICVNNFSACSFVWANRKHVNISECVSMCIYVSTDICESEFVNFFTSYSVLCENIWVLNKWGCSSVWNLWACAYIFSCLCEWICIFVFMSLLRWECIVC